MTRETILGNKSKTSIPLDSQREYVQYHDLVDSQELSEAVLFNDSKKLFSKKSSLDEKKKLLYLLAHNDSATAYKLLRKYRKKPDKQLKAWAELCLQECAGHLGARLLDEEETFMVMSGAGGDGQRLRYYFILSSKRLNNLSVAQKSLVKESAKLVDNHLGGKTEKTEFGKSYILLSVLLPMDVAAEAYFQEIYNAINSKKEILRYHYYCNNIEKPKLKDIKDYLKDLK